MCQSPFPLLTVEYIRGSDYGGGVGGILYTVRGGVPSYTHENRRGDVVAKTDNTGSLTWQGQYNGSGKVTATTGATSDRLKSNSKDCDPWGGINEGQRYTVIRAGDLRTFLTRDPAGFVDGPNLYTYVIQNPWTKFDPEGLDASSTSPSPPLPPPTVNPTNGSSSKPSKPSAPSVSAKQTQQQQVGDIKNYAYGNTRDSLHPSVKDNDCAPVAVDTAVGTVTGKPPGASKSQEEVANAQHIPGQDWSKDGATLNAGYAHTIKTAVEDNPGVQATVVPNINGSGSYSANEMANTISASQNPAIVQVRYPEGNHTVTVQTDKNGNFVVSNLSTDGGTTTFTPQQFRSGRLTEPSSGETATLRPYYPTIVVSPKPTP